MAAVPTRADTASVRPLDGPPALTARRTRLADIDRELARLRHRHDIAMSAFRFEEATALGPAIAAIEKEREQLAAALPKIEPPTGIVPVLARPRRRR
jgi:hypothetical protein